MNTLSIRQSGGASIVSIPRAILKTLGLAIGSQLRLTIENKKITLTPMHSEWTLDEVLQASPKKNLLRKAEDRAWIKAKSIGKEW